MSITRIIHLSDIHYGDDVIAWAFKNTRGYTARPAEKVRKGLISAIKEQRPKYVIISGDFVNKPSRECFSHSAQYLRELLVDANVNISDQVLVVPGNHDVALFKKQPDEMTRLKEYGEFLSKLYDDSSIEVRLPRSIRVDDHNQLIVLLLDTTLKSMLPIAEGEIGTAQLEWAQTKLKELRGHLGEKYDHYLKVAVMHHHCVSIPGDAGMAERNMQLLDSEGILSLLKGHAFDVILHGHKHIPHISNILRGDGGLLTVVGAGTTLAPYPDQQSGYGNNFNMIEVDQVERELKISRLHARPDGTFKVDVGPKSFPIGQPIPGDLKTSKVRRITRISEDGETCVILERTGLRLFRNKRLKTIPLRITTEVPGSKICDFALRKTSPATVVWKHRKANLYDGLLEFDNELTAQDRDTSLIYSYKIDRGTVMSLAEMSSRYTSAAPQFEEVRISLASHVDEFQQSIEFPAGYPAKVELLVEQNGVLLDGRALEERTSLTYDEALNCWTLVMTHPPLHHGLILRWYLPEKWVVRKRLTSAKAKPIVKSGRRRF